jgi:transcriptional regulator with XRE-family HTH domain
LELTAHEKFWLFRQRTGVTQNGLAQKLNISQMHVSRIERGISNPPEDISKLIEQELKERIWVKGDEK